MSDHYDKIKGDSRFRKMWAKKAGFGFELPSVVAKTELKDDTTSVA
jgi:hypothetical protein